MLNFTSLGGTLPGGLSPTPYGMGLFDLMLRFPLVGVQSCNGGGGRALPHCECSPQNGGNDDGTGGSNSGSGSGWGRGGGDNDAEAIGSIIAGGGGSKGGGGGSSSSDPTCFFTTRAWGHGGLDWGSGFPVSGWMPDLNVSFALGCNTGEGFPPGANTTMKVSDNNGAYDVAMCRMVQAVVQQVYPGYPLFRTGPVPQAWNWPTDHWC